MDTKKKGTLLIVDDTPANLKILFTYLRDLNFKARIAQNGKNALKQVTKVPPDLILLDVIMPEMDGYEVCRCLKVNPKTRDIPVIFMSALNETVDKVKGFEIGAVDYITKPFQPEEVLSRINAHLTLRKLQKTLEQKNEVLQQKFRDLTTLYEVSQGFLGQMNEETTLVHIVKDIVERFELKMAWVGLVVKEDFEVHPMAVYGEENDYLKSIYITWDDSITGQGTCGTAIRTTKPLVSNRIDTAPDFALWRASALLRGYCSYAALPLCYSNEVLGVLNLYAAEPDYFTQEKLQILQSFANLAAMALVKARLFDQVQHYTDQLEQRVAQRTSELQKTNEQLQREVSEHQRTEAILKRFLDILEATPDVVWMADKNGNTFFLNRAGRRIKGFRDDEDISKVSISSYHPKHIAKRIINEGLPAAIHDGFWAYETTLLSCEDHEIPTLQVIIAHKSSSGEVEYFSSIARDITERKRTEEKLAQAKEAAEVANRSKSEFLASMSHEFRTPLNGVLGFAQLLKYDKTLNFEQIDAIDTIEQSGNHLLILINDILDLSKIEVGKMELDSEGFSLFDFLQNVVEIIRFRTKKANLDFVYEVLSPLPIMVKNDEIRLRQVLINLLGNAVKFTKQGKVSFKVGVIGNGNKFILDKELSSSHFNLQNLKIRFQIEDTGSGIAPEQLEAIFQPFQQVGEYRYLTEGPGLGLALSKKFLEIMESKLKVKSVLNQGSTFWFDLTVSDDVEKWLSVEQLLSANNK
ncbi:response regulator [Candidatus Parabeggiatoa sp. HSG14]|uniref:response regulator n=1 Tax=Candidatus Parabeggiatoa sp. HSG14 TaxID=3055593 RepID=UPI0025A7456D|nr:response regulator [Thiotrichales bacterium HSG14]